MGEKPKVRIIRMRKVPFIDATAVHNLEILIHSSQAEGIHVVLSGVNQNVREVLEHARYRQAHRKRPRLFPHHHSSENGQQDS